MALFVFSLLQLGSLMQGGGSLVVAVRLGRITLVSQRLANGSDANTTDSEQRTSLMYAALNRDIPMTRLLLRADADPNRSDKYGNTATLFAVFRGDRELVQMLVDAGADPNLANKEDQSPLVVAQDFRNQTCANLLMGLPANPRSAPPSFQAVYEGDLDGLKNLAGQNTSLHWKTVDERTSLQLAVANGDLAMARFLVGKGGDVNAADKNGITGLMFAAAYGRLEVAKYLLDLKVNPNSATVNAITALRIAVHRQDPNMVGLLVRYGANTIGRAKGAALILSSKKLAYKKLLSEVTKRNIPTYVFDSEFPTDPEIHVYSTKRGTLKAPKISTRITPRVRGSVTRSRVAAKVIMEAIIGKTGLVRDVRVVGSNAEWRYGIEKACGKALTKWVFTKGSLAGEPAEFRIQIGFELEWNQTRGQPNFNYSIAMRAQP